MKNLICICMLLPATLWAQETVLAVSGGVAVGSQDAGAVFVVNPVDGSMNVLDVPLPGVSLTGIASSSDNRVFASTSDGRLIEVDPITGGLIGEIGTMSTGQLNVVLHDMAMQPGSDVLFGMVAFIVPADGKGVENTLVTIDTNTAMVNVVGQPNIGEFAPIAFTSDGTLWAVELLQEEGLGNLFTLDPATGAISNQTGTTPAVGALGLGALASDQLLMTECCVDAVGNDVYSLNGPTGAATLLGPAGGNRRIHDFTSVVVTQGEPVPALGWKGLLVLMAGLLTIALFVRARKRSAAA